MIEIFKNLFGGGNGNQAGSEQAQVVEYKGFDILPTPAKINGGWSTAATISKTIEGETKTHQFIRADTTSTRDAAIELIINKAKMCVDQKGDEIFSG